MTALIIASGRFDEIVGVAAIVVAATYTVNYVAMILLRVKEPEMARPFRAWGYPVTTVLVLAASVAFLIVDVRADPVSTVRAGVLLGAALPVYGWTRWRSRKN
jgi:APA family basic amino acid/polyamine antiporter